MMLIVLLVCMVFIVTFFAYLLGSIPFGVVIAKTFCNIDPRSAGSGNVGATNVARLCGKGFGALTLVCDVLKGSLPVYFAVYFIPLLRALLVNIYLTNVASDALLETETLYKLLANIYFLGIVCSGIAVVAGHMFSFFLDFKGGKGVATSVGVFLVLAPFEFAIAGILCLLVIWRSGYVSAGSLVLVTVLPLLLLADILLPDRMTALHELFALPFTNNIYFFILSLVIAVLVIYAHRENIDRLRRGEEKSWIKSPVPK